MSFNLTDLIKDYFSEDVMDILGNILGGSDAQNDLAISSTIPGILSGLINVGASEKGAVSLFDTINGQEDRILDNLDDLLGDDKQSSMFSMGAKALNQLFGEGSADNLIHAVSDYSGSNKSRTGYLVGLLTPVILAVIKRKLLRGNSSFDITNQTNMFNGQKENVLAAMPFGFSDQLESSGFDTINFDLTDNFVSEGFDSIDFNNFDFDKGVKLDSIDLNEKAKVTSDKVIHKNQKITKEGKSISARVFLMAILVGAGFLGYDSFFKESKESSELSSSGKMQTLATDKLNQELTSTLGNLTKTFGSITDLASAKASLPKLSSTKETLGSLAVMMYELPEEARKPITQIVNVNIPKLQSELNKLSTIPGVDKVLKSSLESLSIKLAMFK